MDVPAVGTLGLRVQNKWRRILVSRYGRRDFLLPQQKPVVSFTFDDFPRSALLEGGRVLQEAGVRGTYFVSLNLLDRESFSGQIASRADLRAALSDGHELGCHTFEHLDGRVSSASAFERSITANQKALTEILPGAVFRTFAYPLDGPVLAIKRAVGDHFVACRGGGQTFNSRVIDLNLLKAYFLDRRNRDNLEQVRQMVEANAHAGGWLIFATHDVTADPSACGCDPSFFESVVKLAVESGARVLPMAQACEQLGIGIERHANS